VPLGRNFRGAEFDLLNMLMTGSSEVCFTIRVDRSR